MLGLFATFFITLGIGSVKYPSFGILSVNSTVFHFIQFAVMNMLLVVKDETYRVISGFIFWLTFGLSPHDNLDPAFEYMFRNVNNSHIPNRRLNSVSQYENSTHHINSPIDDVKEIIKWININRLLITIMCLIVVGLIAFIVSFIIGSVKRNLFNILCQKNISRDLQNEEFLSDLKSRAKTSGFTNFMTKIFLISYCNVSSIIVYQLKNGSLDNPWPPLIAGSLVFLFIIGIPARVYYLLWVNKSNMYDPKFVSQYGPIFEIFKETPSKNKFMIVILIKQLLYSIFLNMSSSLDLVQNICLLLTNLVFTIMVYLIQPYKNNSDFIQAFGMSVSMVLISAINFIYVFDGVQEWLILVGSIASSVVYTFTFIMFAVVEIQRKCCSKKEELKEENEDGEEINDFTSSIPSEEKSRRILKSSINRNPFTPQMHGATAPKDDKMEELFLS